MKKHLKEASDEYTQDAIEGISPISAVDADIIDCLSSIIKKVGSRELRALVDKWKLKPDTQVYDDLMDFHSSCEERQEFTIDYITIKNYTIKVGLIGSIEPFDDYDIRKMRLIYKLIINRDERSKMVFANAEIEFSSAEERDREVERLRDRLREFTNIRFL